MCLETLVNHKHNLSGPHATHRRWVAYHWSPAQLDLLQHQVFLGSGVGRPSTES
jgi:hypothetical protein